jgi:hypothetical protein
VKRIVQRIRCELQRRARAPRPPIIDARLHMNLLRGHT